MVGMDAPTKRLQPAPGQFQGFLVPVQGAEFRLGGRLQHGATVPGHAERAVNDLRGKADQDEKNEFSPVHSVSPPSK